MQLTRDGERGSTLITALLAALVMLALGLALLSIVDVQAKQSGVERTRDRAFNLSESVLTSHAFVLGRNWPASAVTTGAGTIAAPLEQACSAPTAAAAAALGTTPPAGTVAALLQPNLNATYTDTAYTGATWQLNVCDDNGSSTVWDDATLTNGTKNWDRNQNKLLWVRAQSTVEGRTRAVAGLVRARTGPALQAKYGLVSGNVSGDLTSTMKAITNAAVVESLTLGLLSSNPVVAPDPAFPVPASGVTGLRCGLLDDVPDVQKTCVTGAIGALSSIPLLDDLVANGRYTQFPTTTSTSEGNIGQLRAQAKASGTYTAASAGAAASPGAPNCQITGTPNASTVVFIEQVGTGDQYCVIDLAAASRQYKALVVGRGRVIFRGDNNVDGATAYSPTATKNLFAGVVYALNQQTSCADPCEVVRVEQGARIRGTVNADGKNAIVSLRPPDFNSSQLVCSLLPCPGLLSAALQPLGITELVNTLVSGGCLLRVLGVCTLSLPPTPLGQVLTSLTAQLTTYGSPIHSDVAIVNALQVNGASGVVPGSFRDLQPAR